jgi:hypothetical protein
VLKGSGGCPGGERGAAAGGQGLSGRLAHRTRCDGWLERFVRADLLLWEQSREPAGQVPVVFAEQAQD